MHRGGDDECVRSGELFYGFVHPVAYDADAGLFAGAAGCAAGDRPGADLDELGLNALSCKDLFHLAQGETGAALLVRAAAYHDDFHVHASLKPISMTTGLWSEYLKPRSWVWTLRTSTLGETMKPSRT